MTANNPDASKLCTLSGFFFYLCSMARKIEFRVSTTMNSIQVQDYDSSTNEVFNHFAISLGNKLTIEKLPRSSQDMDLSTAAIRIIHQDSNNATGYFRISDLLAFYVDGVDIVSHLTTMNKLARAIQIFASEEDVVFAVCTGTDNYEASPQHIKPLATLQRIYAIFPNTNTDDVTVSLWGSAAIDVYKGGTTQLDPGDIEAGTIYRMEFQDGIGNHQFQISLDASNVL